MFQILAEYGYKLLRMRYLPICLVTTSSCCAINPNALAIFERSVVLSLAQLSLVVSFDTGGAGAFGLLVGTGGAGLFDLYLLTAALALLGLGRLLVFLFVFAFAGRLWVELLLFVFSCPSLAPADAGRSKFVRHTITMASLACEIGHKKC